MAEGTKTYEGLAVPLYGESEIKAQTLATDILTLTGASGHTGDFLVCQTYAGTEVFVVKVDGSFGADLTMTAGENVVLSKTDQTTFSRLTLPVLNSAPASAGLAKGDIWLAKATTDVYRLAMCISTAAGTVRYGGRIIRATIGTASH